MTRQAPTLTEAIEWAKAGQDSMTKCVAHDDGTASLHVSPGRDQPVVLKCHAGCETDAILAAEGLGFDAILGERDPVAHEEWTPIGPASHVYPYTDEQGTLLFQTLRIPQPGGGKTFRQRHRGPDGRWVWNLDGVRRVLYRLPDVLRAKAEGVTIYLVEGEKDVHTLAARGLVATTNPMGAGNSGAGKWKPEFTQALAGANVIIISDADDAGRTHVRYVRKELLEAGCTVTVYEPARGAKDITEHIEKGLGFRDLIETVPEEQDRPVRYGVDILDLVRRSTTDIEFVIPNTLARGDRLLITGWEGHGKSTLLRQMAVQVAAGIHPWSLRDVEPKRVLVIDAENHPDQTLASWQDLVGLAARHNHPLARGMLTVLEEWDNDDLDLLTSDGHAWLAERVHGYRPDLVVMGPLTNMAGRDLKDDETVRKIKSAVNTARSICGTAFVMEHHAPHKGPSDRERPLRPYGSSMFLKWPDFGYGLKPTEDEFLYEFIRTRFPRVRSRSFPEVLRAQPAHATDWPWTVAPPI